MRLAPPPGLPPRTAPTSTSAASSSTSTSTSTSSTASSTSSAASADPDNAVFLNIYDVLTPDDPVTIPRLNSLLINCGLGVFHTGVHVWGHEFAFGGHPGRESGIFRVSPRECPAVRFRSSVLLGYTKVARPDVLDLVDFLGSTEYTGVRYSLVSRNCNSFSLHLARLLGVAHNFPNWVNRLAAVALNLKCILPEGVHKPISDAPPPAARLIAPPKKPPPIAYFS